MYWGNRLVPVAAATNAVEVAPEGAAAVPHSHNTSLLALLNGCSESVIVPIFAFA
jgi:hypothetical protein